MILLFVLPALFLSACFQEEAARVGYAAPDFTSRNLHGHTTGLSSLRGKVVLINFWATWCDPCRAEMPSMEALYGSQKRNDFEILAVSIDTGNPETVHDYVREFGFRFPILLDNHLVVNRLYQVRMLPSSFLIDRKGIIREVILGARDWNDPEMREIVVKLTQEK